MARLLASPGASVSHGGKVYTADQKGVLWVPEEAAAVFVRMGYPRLQDTPRRDHGR